MEIVQKQVARLECFGTFNMGVGFVLIVPKTEADGVLKTLGEDAFILGEMQTGSEPLILK